MSEMVERVARAISDSLHGDTHSGRWEVMAGDVNLSNEFKDRMRRMARAAIETMREPTDAMLQRTERVLDDDHEAALAWRTMIDAALDETKSPAQR